MLDVPIHPNVLWPTAQEARSAGRADIALTLCDGCGLIWNVGFDPDALSYEQEYENSLHFSGEFQRYGEALADRLIDHYELERGHVAEIGSGKGEFLALLCERGARSGIGFDPSYDGEADGRASGRLTFVRDVLREDSDLGRPKLVVCRHVLEHLFDPVKTLRALRTALGEYPAGLYIEVPSAEYLLREAAIWDVIYPHVTSLTASALRTIVERAGFHVRTHGFSFGGQYLWIEASTDRVERQSRWSAEEDVSALVTHFARRADEKRAFWTDRLQGVERGSVALWGAGAKGATFLNVVAESDAVGLVIDVNPRKHGRFISGTGQPIGAPDALAQAQPEAVIVTNVIYRNEIEGAVRTLSADAEILLA